MSGPGQLEDSGFTEASFSHPDHELILDSLPTSWFLNLQLYRLHYLITHLVPKDSFETTMLFKTSLKFAVLQKQFISYSFICIPTLSLTKCTGLILSVCSRNIYSSVFVAMFSREFQEAYRTPTLPV